jgi:hypothetical protein
MPGSTQAIGMACVSVGMAVGRGHAARILRAFSTLRYARGDLRADRSADMSERDSDFRIKPGRIRSTRAPRTKSSSFGRGRIAQFSRARLFSSSRRVVVKARIARHQGRAFGLRRLMPTSLISSATASRATVRKAVMFDADSDRADDAGFAERSKDDRHHFRFIVSPEDAGRDDRPARLHARPRAPNGSRPRDAARLGRGRSLEHRQSPRPPAGARR